MLVGRTGTRRWNPVDDRHLILVLGWIRMTLVANSHTIASDREREGFELGSFPDS
jgi:hypothetical protein